MNPSAIKKEINGYLPLLTTKQQKLLLEMAKSLVTEDKGSKRVSKKQRTGLHGSAGKIAASSTLNSENTSSELKAANRWVEDAIIC